MANSDVLKYFYDFMILKKNSRGYYHWVYNILKYIYVSYSMVLFWFLIEMKHFTIIFTKFEIRKFNGNLLKIERFYSNVKYWLLKKRLDYFDVK